MKRAFTLALACLFLSSVSAEAQTRRRTRQRQQVPATTFAEKQQAELRTGRQQIAAQIKTLSQFLYLFGGISKGIETAEQVNRNREQSSVGMPPAQIEQTKTKFKDSIKNVRVGLEQLESSFRLNPVLQTYYPSLAGSARLAQTAESQAAANNFDQAGRSLIAAVNRLVDALLALR
ncbi:MAG TPA: hypothetical protein VLM38_06125 [Blastocatellia bacterium]|nr:hypothetical protein [Blastocatellia bacterium]